MNHPAVMVALAYGAGLLLAEYIQPQLGLLFGATLGIAVTGVLSSAARPRLLWPLVFLVGWTNQVHHTTVLSPNDLRRIQGVSPTIVSLRGTLAETPDQRISWRDERETARSLAVLEVETIRHETNCASAFGKVLVLTRGVLPHEFFSGQKVEVTGVLEPPPRPTAEGLFDYRSYLARQNIYYQLKADSAEDWKLVSPGRQRPYSDRFLAWARSTLARGLPGEDQSLELLWAMTLGWKSGLTNEVYEPFMRSGTMHIFAISGLHIALIAAILVALLRVIRISRGWCGGVVVPLIWFYTGVTGWQPSAIRSVIMMTIVIGGWSLRRPTNLINSLAASALLILIWDPQQLFGASFQLSFFCVLILALLLPPLERICDHALSPHPLLPPELVPVWRQRLRIPLRWFFLSLATSIATWLGSLALTAYYFHLFTPVTVFANLAIVPLSSLALGCNLGSLICGSWSPWMSELFNHSAWFWMECMVRFSQWCSSAPGFYLYVRSPSLMDLAFYYLCLVGAVSGWLLEPRRRKWAVIGAILVCVVHFKAWVAGRHCAQISILPANGGVSIFVQAPKAGGSLLIDPGTTNSVEWTIKGYLRGQGVNQLQAMVLTHGDVRHTGGATLLTALFRPRHIYVSPVKFRSAPYRRALSTLGNTPGRISIVGANDRIGTWRVLHPQPQDRFAQADDNSMALLGTLYGTRILLLSDLGLKGQNALLERQADLRADIAVTGIPNHGEALTPDFLDAVQPRLIIVVDSDYPVSERASPRLMERLTNSTIPVLYTRTAGATTILLNPSGWQAKSLYGGQLGSETLKDGKAH